MAENRIKTVPGRSIGLIRPAALDIRELAATMEDAWNALDIHVGEEYLIVRARASERPPILQRHLDRDKDVPHYNQGKL